MQNVIDRTNKFYLLMSRHLLSKKEYGVLEKLLIEKMPMEQATQQYGLTSQEIRELYQKIFNKAKEAAELFSQIDHYQKKLEKLKRELNPNPSPAAIKKEKAQHDRRKLIFSSPFPFSTRLRSVLEALEISTIGELSDIPLKDFQHFRGFKTKCKEELAVFIESENIGYLFKGFAVWKKQTIEQLK